MSEKYLKTKEGSIEDTVKNLQNKVLESDYQDKFKKELENAGKPVGHMTGAEKKEFYSKVEEATKLSEKDGANTSSKRGSASRNAKKKYRFGYRVAEKDPKGEKELEEIRIRPKRVVETTPTEKEKRLKRAKDMIRFYDKQKKAALKGPNKDLAKKMLKSGKKIENKNHPAKKKWETMKVNPENKDDNSKDILPKSQEPTQKTDPMNIQTKEPEKKRTDNGTKSDKIDVNPRIDYHA